MTDVNVEFTQNKLGQIERLRANVEASRQAVADYDAGKTQAALDAQLAADVASGRIRMLGTDRYEVLEGWDRNETFMVQRAVRPTEIPLILPTTGLDYVDGVAQLYTSQPAWHFEGNLIPGGTNDVETVLNEGGIAYGVETRPVRYFMPDGQPGYLELPDDLAVPGGVLRKDPRHFVTVRDDTWAPLGVVGSIYEPFQNRDGAAFLHELVNDHGVVFESAGPLRGGRQAFISMRLPEDIIVDEGGVADPIRPYLCWMNSHDGSSPLRVITTPWCPRCGNTHDFALRDAQRTWSVRHTRNGLERTDEARRTLDLAVKYYGVLGEQETQLAQTTVLLDDFRKLIDHLWEPAKDDDPQRKQTISENRTERLIEMYVEQAATLGETGYAAENVITDYLDHETVRKPRGTNMAAARATAILEGASGDIKSKAHRKLLTMKNVRLAA